MAGYDTAGNCSGWPNNVGKNSFINAMCGRKKLAYVGNTPGKTRLLNFFNLDDKYMFVDVPGYGYANISKTQLIKFGQMMEDYFSERTQKKGVVILVDARHKPTDDDMTMLEFARYYEIPVAVVATKCDKVPPTKRAPIISQTSRKTLKLNADDPVSTQLLKSREWRNLELSHTAVHF